METVERDYTPKGVRFYYLYKALVHPEYHGYITPFTLEERLMHAKEAQRRLGSRIPWIVDAMTNDLKHALGNAPNGEFIVDPEGKVARRRASSDPTALRADLEELVGAVEKPTRVEDLDLQARPPPAPTVATGVVPRVEVPGTMRALRIEPVLEGNKVPFYVKLRAEADQDFLREGEGQLYLGFHLDPLYEVHWNNLAPPLELEIEAPDGVRVTPAKLQAPKPKEEADADPREFLVRVAADRIAAEEGSSDPLQLSVLYYACDNANTFCVPVRQNYAVHLTADSDGGSPFSRTAMPGGAGFLDSMDSNADGTIDAHELEAADKNRDALLGRAPN